MKSSTLRFNRAAATALSLVILASPGVMAAEQTRSRLHIQHDRQNKRAIISWAGSGHELAKSWGRGARFERLNRTEGPVAVDVSGDQMSFALLSTAESIVSENIVGYVNVQLPWGMSFIANPLYQTNQSLGYLFPVAPDRAQVLYWMGTDYDTSVFDAATMTWTKPGFDLSPGIGFFFINPGRDTFTQTFVGEVRTGTLVNHIPAGISLEASLLPQAGSINSLHNIPGQAGDVLFIYVNEPDARGRYNRSTFSATDNAWVPDQELGVAQGFWIQKRQGQDWVRNFSIFP